MSTHSDDPDDFVSILQAAMEARSSQVNTCLPGIVQSYDHATQTAVIRPALQRPMLTHEGEPMAERLPDITCPVIFARGAGYILHVPLAAGDAVLLVFTQWNMNEWRRQGGTHVDPGDHRHHSLGSAVAIPGLFPADTPVAGLSATECLLGTVDGIQVRLTAGHLYLGKASNPMKRAARKTDPVKVTIPIGAVVVNVTGGGGSPAVGVTNIAPIECVGTITEGSPTVDVSD